MFEINENIPKVTILNGRASKFKTGFKSTSKSVSARPPSKNVNIPPDIFTPGKT